MLSKATSSSIVKPIPPALEVKNVSKAYTRNKPILLNANMTVSQGEIYGLLGASGCGKTTILSCIAGIQEVDSGNIIPFGNQNLKNLKQVLGFMPQDFFILQETTLYEFLTVKETLQFFGRVYGLAEMDIDQQIKHFCKLLQLPNATNKIKDLSGGERRRSSLATCLIHSPKLLLLDEPTVGLDPVIRERIWNYLQELSTTKNTTVIFSTHYIEEVRNSDKIGVMRDGRILIEKAPGQLLEKYKATFLEEVVLKLYKDDLLSNDLSNLKINDKKLVGKMCSFLTPQNEITCLSFTKTSQFEYLEEFSVTEQNEEIHKTRKIISRERFNIRLGRIKAVTIKNFLNFYRNPIFITALILLPVLQIIVTALFIGPLPKNMKLGVVNQELPHWKDRCFNKLNESKVFCGAGFSCLFLNQLALPNFFDLVQIQFEEEAMDQVRLGKLWGYISIPGNYSEYFTLRGAQGLFAEGMTLERSIIKVKLDMSDYLAGFLMYSNILKAFATYTKDVANVCGDNPRKYELPLKSKSVFGEDATYMEYIIPSSLILAINMLVHGICSVSIITERKYGMLSRSKVAGVESTDIIIGYFITEATPVFLQSAIGTGILIFGFNLQIRGSIALFVLICILSGLCGQASGFLAGNILKDEMEAIFTGIFLFMPMLLLVGAIWPLEAMPSILRQISHCFPLTLACESLRSVTSRGLSFTHTKVWPGIAMLSGWTLIFWIIAYFLLKTSKTK